ncbi:hypothetical protein RMSM_02204 [Rhodopirellula maiorica SM1]|uniref:Uncharacterized protein n=1 Tax=Rhodopirellula maiorica SM1 TaxID=1265738 RepID=M5RNI0_9BACT|nr:hypothetical protein [Rhodopirellula maiorica]EMI20873.1 hypothetical protein RMSM_02204 [Rhodopirellula maiorica SM1]
MSPTKQIAAPEDAKPLSDEQAMAMAELLLSLPPDPPMPIREEEASTLRLVK